MKEKGNKREERKGRGKESQQETKEELDSLLFSSLCSSLFEDFRGKRGRRQERKESEGEGAGSSNDYPERGKSFVLEEAGASSSLPTLDFHRPRFLAFASISRFHSLYFS